MQMKEYDPKCWKSFDYLLMILVYNIYIYIIT